jgi:hypothetical protein
MFFDLRPGSLTPSQFRDFGFWIDWEEGTVLPQYFHFYPSLLAAFASFVGLARALYLNAFLAALGVGLLFILGRRLAGFRVGLLASAFLATSFSQFWFSRFPSAEILFQVLFLMGMVTFLFLLRTQHPIFGLLSGLSLASTILVRLDGLFLVPVVAALFLTVGHRLSRIGRLSFGVAYLGVYALSILYIVTLGYNHFSLQISGLGLEPSRAEMLGILATSFALLALVVFRPPFLVRLNSLNRRKISRALSLLLASALLAILVTTPWSAPGRYGWNLAAVSFYTTPLGFALAAAGLLVMTRTAGRDARLIPFLVLALPFFLIYVPNSFVQLYFPWFLRRWIHVIIPVLAVGAAFGIDRLSNLIPLRRNLPIRNAVTLTLALAIILPNVILVASFAPIKENEGLIEATRLFATNFDEESVIIFYSRSGGFALPLAYIHGLKAMELQYDPFAREMGDAFLEAIDGWMAQNLTVYIVNPSSVFLQEMSRTHSVALIWSTVITVQQYRMSYASQEFDIITRTFPLGVYEVGLRQAQANSSKSWVSSTPAAASLEPLGGRS